MPRAIAKINPKQVDLSLEELAKLPGFMGAKDGVVAMNGNGRKITEQYKINRALSNNQVRAKPMRVARNLRLKLAVKRLALGTATKEDEDLAVELGFRMLMAEGDADADVFTL